MDAILRVFFFLKPRQALTLRVRFKIGFGHANKGVLRWEIDRENWLVCPVTDKLSTLSLRSLEKEIKIPNWWPIAQFVFPYLPLCRSRLMLLPCLAGFFVFLLASLFPGASRFFDHQADGQTQSAYAYAPPKDEGALFLIGNSLSIQHVWLFSKFWIPRLRAQFFPFLLSFSNCIRPHRTYESGSAQYTRQFPETSTSGSERYLTGSWASP